MKNFVLLFSAIILFTACTSNEGINESQDVSLSGEWQDVNSESFTDCTAIFEQRGDSVYMVHFFHWNGKPFFEKGRGIIKGDSVIYKVNVVHGIEGWSTEGTHYLKLNDRSLEGYYKDNIGNTGPIKFTQLRN